MSLQPWRTIAKPHSDVLHGTFKQSEFAADITQVHTGTATDEYQDAEKFFARTYITEGMRLLLTSVAQRLAGQGGDPVIQLQTAFGGGKTHTMLAVYHLASRKTPTDKLHGIPPILDQAGIHNLPQARIAVIDGINLAPSEDSVKKSGKKVSTLWGEIAYQLLGDAGMDMVRESHEQGTSPGKEILVKLLTQAAPCVILIDELVAYLRQFETGRTYKAGTFDSNLTFIQALTEAMKAVPNAILLASLPESEIEVGGTMGQLALSSLEKYFARVESVWKPVAAQESFEIVRRRLFEDAGSRSDIEAICRQFHDFYKKNPQSFPQETQSNEYLERMCQSYPIHPEVFDRLYEDWSTLDKFQKTRGVLQYMAVVIHYLWQTGNSDAMILPGSIPLNDPMVRNKSIHYLATGWEPVIEKEVDGNNSEPTNIDNQNTLFGSVQAARRVMRTIFLGSAASNSSQLARGIKLERVLLGAMQSGQTIGVFEDVLKRLRDKLHYLYAEHDRYWLDTKPNLRREMESRKANLSERDEVQPLIKMRLNDLLSKKHSFAGVHLFLPSADIPDDYGSGPRLVVLPTVDGYSNSKNNAAFIAAEKILRTRGDQPRQKQNRLIFLAPDFDVVSRLREHARIFLAWRSIIADIDSGSLNQDIASLNQAKQNLIGATKSLDMLLRDAFKWLIVPTEIFVNGKPTLEWETVQVSTTSQNLVNDIEQKLREEEWLIFEWSPIHLRKLLADWYFKADIKHVQAQKVWQDSANYLYMPRLANHDVFRNTVIEAIHSKDFFAYAAGIEGDRYLGFHFGDRSITPMDDSSLLIEREEALAYEERIKPAPVPPISIEQSSISSQPQSFGEPTVSHSSPIAPVNTATPKELMNQFYGSISLDPVRAKMDFATLMDEVIQQFTSKLGVDVTISIEVQAKAKAGFDEQLQRTIKENCSVLKFSSAEFEKE